MSDKTQAEHNESASLIGRLGSSAFRLSTTAVSMSLTGSRFSSESHQGRSIMGSEDEVEQSHTRPCVRRAQVQADSRTHLIHRPARDIIPPLGGARVSSYLDPVRGSCCRHGLLPGPPELSA